MALNDLQIKGAKAKDKDYKLTDGDGLYVLVRATGTKLFRFNYRFAQKRKTLAIGKYPDISLAEARKRLAEARNLVANGIDPSEFKKAQKAEVLEQSKNTFEAVFLEWHLKQSYDWSKAHAKRVDELFRRDLLPWLGKQSIAELSKKPRELMRTFERIQERGAIDTGQRAKQLTGQLFAYAFSRELCEQNPIPNLRGQLLTPKKKNYPALIKPNDFGQMLRDIQPYKGSFVIRCALHIWPLVIVRTDNIIRMEWSEIDLDSAMWTIPGEKMKMDNDHLVPLSRQAISILEEIKPLSGHQQHVFPGRGNNPHISDNSLNHALYKCGDYKGRMCMHGMRSSFKTIGLEVLDFKESVIEAVLAHAPADSNGTAYNRAAYLQQRRIMLQSWADYLDSLRDGKRGETSNVINFR